MCLCVCMCIQVCIQTCMCVYASMCTHIYMYACTRYASTGISGVLMPHEAAHLVASRTIPLLQQHSRLGAAVRLLRAALPLLITRPLPPFSRNSARAEGAAHEEAGRGGEEYCDSARVREHLQALSGVIAYYGAQDVLTSRERMSLLSLSIEWCEAVPARQVRSIMCVTDTSLTDMRDTSVVCY